MLRIEDSTHAFSAPHALKSRRSPSREPAEPPIITRIRKEDLRRFFRDLNVVRCVAPSLGIPPVGLNEPFCCILPGHEKSHPSARLFRNRRGVIVYRDLHASGCISVYTMPEVYFARTTREIRKLRGPTCAVWALRLLAEASVVRPVHIDLPKLPMSASSDARKVFAGFGELLALKWTYQTGAQPTPFSHRFAAAWCGISEKQACDAIRELLSLKAIFIAGYVPGPYGKPMALFSPGRGHDDGGRTPVLVPASQSSFGGSPDDN